MEEKKPGILGLLQNFINLISWFDFSWLYSIFACWTDKFKVTMEDRKQVQLITFIVYCIVDCNSFLGYWCFILTKLQLFFLLLLTVDACLCLNNATTARICLVWKSMQSKLKTRMRSEHSTNALDMQIRKFFCPVASWLALTKFPPLSLSLFPSSPCLIVVKFTYIKKLPLMKTKRE